MSTKKMRIRGLIISVIVLVMMMVSEATAQTGNTENCPTDYNQVNYGMTTDYTAPVLSGTQPIGTVMKFPHKPNWFRWDLPQGLNSSHWWWGKSLQVSDVIAPWYDGFDFPDLMKEYGEYKAEHGWELVVENLGINYNGGATPMYKKDEIYPMVVLYNKYRSILRVFWYIPDNENPNLARFSLRVTSNELYPNDSKIPNLIHTSTYDAPLIALDRLPFTYVPDNNGVLEKVNPQNEVVRQYPQTLFGNNVYDAKWMYADYFIQYDPCVCKHPSAMELEVTLIDEVLIETTALTKGEIVNKNGGTMRAVDDAGNHSIGLSDFGKGGLKVLKSAGSNVSGEVKLSAKDKFDKGIINYDDYVKAQNDGTALDDFVSGLTKFGSFLKTAKPYVSFALDMIDLVTGGGSKGPTTVKIMPMTMWSETKTNGKLTSIEPKPVVNFNTPGSQNSTTVNNTQQENRIPYYNNPLGVFNLLRTPKVKVNRVNNPKLNCVESQSNFIFSYKKCEISWDEDVRHRIKLDSDPEFVVNPASGLEIEDMIGAIVVEYEKPKNPGVQNSTYWGSLTQFQFTDELTHRISENQWRTQYMPIGCLKDAFIDIRGVRIGAGYHFMQVVNFPWTTNPCEEYDCTNLPNTPHPKITNVFLKLTVQFKHKQQGRKRVVHHLTFPVEIEETNDEAIFTTGWTGYKKSVNFTSGGTVVSTKVWEDITISGNAAFQSGATELVAGKSITVSGGDIVISSQQSQEVIMRIGDPVDCNITIYPKGAEQVHSFCESVALEGYKPPDRSPAKIVLIDNEPVQYNSSEYPEAILHDAYPNPFGNYTLLRYSIGQPGRVELFVTNALGQRVATLVDSQHGRGTFDVSFGNNSELATGVYYYTLRTDTFIQTKSVVLIR